MVQIRFLRGPQLWAWVCQKKRWNSHESLRNWIAEMLWHQHLTLNLSTAILLTTIHNQKQTIIPMLGSLTLNSPSIELYLDIPLYEYLQPHHILVIICNETPSGTVKFIFIRVSFTIRKESRVDVPGWDLGFGDWVPTILNMHVCLSICKCLC